MVTIHINQIPPSPNVLRRKYRHPKAYMRLRMQWENDIFFSLTLQQRKELVTAASEGRTGVWITIAHSRKYDPDNLAGSQKPILDALKNLHFIADDDEEHIYLLPTLQVKVPRNESRTIIKIFPRGTVLHEEVNL